MKDKLFLKGCVYEQLFYIYFHLLLICLPFFTLHFQTGKTNKTENGKTGLLKINLIKKIVCLILSLIDVILMKNESDFSALT